MANVGGGAHVPRGDSLVCHPVKWHLIHSKSERNLQVVEKLSRFVLWGGAGTGVLPHLSQEWALSGRRDHAEVPVIRAHGGHWQMGGAAYLLNPCRCDSGVGGRGEPS